MSGYRLRAGVSFCTVGPAYIFLDVPADRYFALDDEVNHAFGQMVRGADLATTGYTALDRLVRTGVLEVAAPTDRPAPATSHFSDVYDPGAPIASVRAARDVAPLIITQLLARRLVGRRNLSGALALARCDANLSQVATMDAGRVAQIIAARRMSTRLLSSYGQCLTISIATTRRLRQIGVAATLLIGVKLRPFEAHSWVQIEHALVAEQPDYIRNFTPILVR